ncbi:hypothetical protein [Planobispora longispora]|uniref:DUF4352 domain-containing protein n=1 Tax=Planobispora longispora TaxID=28887 RepID=A0A8J3W436_9ACTN|nr:hypothetical protein [Planobispora longispora]GIH76024.1 hypothetical protein Plo01_24530 [Planobispora longispora]
MTSPPGGGTRRRRPVAVPLAILAIATGLGITAALGGFAEAPKEPPKQLGPGAAVDQKLFLTKFVASRTVFQPDEYGGEGKRFLEVELEVTNKGDRTEGVGSPGQGGKQGLLYGKSLLKMTPEITNEFGPISMIIDEGVPSQQLHPGMTSAVVFRYELAQGQQAPENVTFDVGVFDPDPDSVTGADLGLILESESDAKGAPPKVEAKVTLPVQRGEAG